MARKIEWKLIEVDKSKIKLNPHNPKVKDAKGFKRLEKLRDKYGLIFDGILNADLSMIDGHRRHELNPEGTGKYFVPSKQLSEKDYKELNALFDLAKAGNPDMLMVEEQIGEEMMEEYELDSKKKDNKPKDVDLVPYKRTHVLLSFPPEKMVHIQKYLQKITEFPFVEYEQSNN